MRLRYLRRLPPRLEMPLFVTLTTLACGLLFLVAIMWRLDSFVWKIISPEESLASVFGCWLGDCSLDPDDYEPSCTISSLPSSFPSGGPATLSWSSNIVSPFLTPTLGIVSANASAQVTPVVTTVYTLQDNAGAYGSWRSFVYWIAGIQTPISYCAVAASVILYAPPPPPPSLSIQTQPEHVRKGDTISITWSASNVSSCSVADSFGASIGTGLTTPVPAPTQVISETTMFTLSCVVSGGGEESRTTTVRPGATFKEI